MLRKQLDDSIEIRCYLQVTSESQEKLVQRVTALGGENSPILLVNLDLVASIFHLQSAIIRSKSNQQGKMKTKFLATEILYQLANTGKISEAIIQYSLPSKTNAVALVRLNSNESTIQEYNQLCHEVIQGEEINPNEIESLLLTEEKRGILFKIFKFSPQEMQCPLDDILSTKLCLKDV